MPYDFSVARIALSKAAHVEGWADKKSAQLNREYLIPLAESTIDAEHLADDISAFVFDIESKLNEIINRGERNGF